MKRLGSLLVLSALAAGCTQGLPGLRPVTYATPGEARIYVSDDPCIHDPPGREFAGLLAAIATTAISTLLQNFGNTLTEAAKGGNLPTAAASRNLTLPPGRVPGCVTFVRGAFSPTERHRDPVPLDTLVDLPQGNMSAEARARLTSLNIPAIYRLDQFVQLRLVEAPGRRAVAFFPRYIRVNRSIDGATSGERDLTLTLKFTKPGSTDAGSVVVVPRRRIGTGQIFSANENNGRPIYESPWFAFPNGIAAPSQPSGRPGGQAEVPPPTPPAVAPGQDTPSITGGAGLGTPTVPTPNAAAGAEADNRVPVTVIVTSVETRATNEGLAFVASVFNGVRPQLNTELTSLISSDAAATEDAAALALEAEWTNASGAARVALLQYCRNTSTADTVAGQIERAQRSAAAQEAQIKANRAAVRSGRAQPYPILVEITEGVRQTSEIPACSALG